ncbi:MAG: acyl-CoA dehydrogenase family protein [Bdellovibrionales bacterium]|nr:acyl-CoA dehydrogenase family protein [Bdellovibrionales bacterium]
MTYNSHFLNLTDDQAALKEEALKFAQKEIVPVAGKYDASSEFPKDILKKAHSLGLFNLTIDENLGGTGLGIHDACLIIEELAAGCGGFATSIVANDLALIPILIAGNDKQKEKFVKNIAEAGDFASFCLSEPGAGSDAGGISTNIKADGDYYILNGAKQWITNGGHAKQFTVFATIDKEKKHKGICCLVVPRDLEGVSTGHHENKLGQRCSNTVSVNFDNVKVPKENLLGAEGDGFVTAMKTLDKTRPMTAIIATGIARAAFLYALDYAKDRKQFSRPIADFQAVQFMLADMATSIDAARLLTLRSAEMLDRGVDASTESSMAKRFAADEAMQITTNAVQIYGGYGYTKEYPVEKLMRDAKLMQIYEGTSQIQRIVIAKGLLRD